MFRRWRPGKTRCKLPRASLSGFTQDVLNSPATNCDNTWNVVYQGSSLDTQSPQGYYQGWVPSTDQNPRLPEGKQVCNIGQVVCTNSSGTESHSDLWGMVGTFPKSRFTDSSLRASLASRPVGTVCYACNSFLPRNPQPFFALSLWQDIAVPRCQLQFIWLSFS